MVVDLLLLFALIVNTAKLSVRRVSTDNVKHAYLVTESTRPIVVLHVKPIATSVGILPLVLIVTKAISSLMVIAQLVQ
jgi:hypothetical protein